MSFVVLLQAVFLQSRIQALISACSVSRPAQFLMSNFRLAVISLVTLCQTGHPIFVCLAMPSPSFPRSLSRLAKSQHHRFFPQSGFEGASESARRSSLVPKLSLQDCSSSSLLKLASFAH